MAEVGSAKAASSNVESVFSGAGGMAANSTSISGDLLSDYAVCHDNWQYEWLRPTEEEFLTACPRRRTLDKDMCVSLSDIHVMIGVLT